MPSPLTELLPSLRAAVEGPGPREDGEFNELALPLFHALRQEIPAWGRLCRHRGVDPERVSRWQDIPPMPTAAFRSVLLHAPSAGEAVRVFETSGTTADSPGRVPYDPTALALMDLAIDQSARSWLFPDGGVKAVHVLGPSPEKAPGKIMLQGMRRLADTFGGGKVKYHVGARGLDAAGVADALYEAGDDGEAVLVAGASSAFLAVYDFMERNGVERVDLAPGSRVLHAGGYKGLGRELARSEFLELTFERTGLSQESCINLLGMTELSSQFYEDSRGAWHAGTPSREGFVNAPWTRTQVVDPDSLNELAEGEIGLLAHWDLASATHPFAVLTTDLGKREGDRFFLLGRATGAELRGCSLDATVLTG